MIEKLKNLIRKIIHPNHYCSKAYVKYLQQNGVIIGEGTYFFDPIKTNVDISRPYLLEIGNYCKITGGVIILTHDYSYSVLRRVFHDILGECHKTVIGDNVFIGMNSIIMPGVHIGNNVIIGAGSVVTKNIPNNCIYAGNPARIISNLDDYYSKLKNNQLEGVTTLIKEFFNKNNRYPSIKEINSFFPLFLNRTKDDIYNENVNISWNGDNKDDILKDFLESEDPISSYELFIKNIK